MSDVDSVFSLVCEYNFILTFQIFINRRPKGFTYKPKAHDVWGGSVVTGRFSQDGASLPAGIKY